MTRPNTVEDYEARVDRWPDRGGCHFWTGACNKEGYGVFYAGGKRWLAHRFGWVQLHGELGPDERVLHTCDNPPCQNPRHWFKGTQLDNIADRHAKGRDHRPIGENNPRAKLTDRDVVRLRAAFDNGITVGQLAEDFEIHRSHVWRLTRKVSR